MFNFAMLGEELSGKFSVSKRHKTAFSVLLMGCVFTLLYMIPRTYDMFKSSRQFSSEQPFSNVMPEDDGEREILERIRKYTNQLPNSTEVTVVTAYFNIGNVERGWRKSRPPETYLEWMSTFRWLDNPLIVFTDSVETVALFRQIRADYSPSRTVIFFVNREELWSFQLADEIEKIFSQPGYPRQVTALYCCALHAKFELLKKVVSELRYPTRYVAWLDIGLFRKELKKNETIHLTVPRDFKRTHVAYSQVLPLENVTIPHIMTQEKPWVGGASFLATPEVMYVYCKEYQRAVQKLLEMKWMHTDQRVIYSMVQPSFNFSLRVPIQAFTTYPTNKWFAMGYLMKLAPSDE